MKNIVREKRPSRKCNQREVRMKEKDVKKLSRISFNGFFTTTPASYLIEHFSLFQHSLLALFVSALSDKHKEKMFSSCDDVVIRLL